MYKEHISNGKCKRLCFHVPRFLVNSFCVSLNSLSGNIQWCPEVLTNGTESSCNTQLTDSQHLFSIARKCRYTSGVTLLFERLPSWAMEKEHSEDF